MRFRKKESMRTYLFLLFTLIFPCTTVFAQKDSLQSKTKIYQLNYVLDIPITITGLVASKYGTDYLRGREPRDMDRISELNPDNIWWFDRGATKQDPLQADKYLQRSNVFMRGAMFLPALMFLDPKVRDIWYDYTLLYLEAQSINASAYLVGAMPISRLRPFMYNPDESMERKLGRNTTNSFFSGHTSVVATSTFFVVKVYFDLHPDAHNRLLWYSLASIPPAITGYCRYKAAKHFPTDILTGFGVGVLTGILVPEWHKSKANSVCVYPTISDNILGFYARITLR